MLRRAVLGVLLVLVPVGLRGEGPAAPVDPVVAELTKLNGALREIVGLLKKQGEAQELDLLMKRLQISEARLADSERALKSAEEERRSLEHERSRIETHLAVIESAKEREGVDLAAVEAEAAHGRGELKRSRQRSAELAIEIGDLENDIASRRAEVRSWLSALDRRLGPR